MEIIESTNGIAEIGPANQFRVQALKTNTKEFESIANLPMHDNCLLIIDPNMILIKNLCHQYEDHDGPESIMLPRADLEYIAYQEDMLFLGEVIRSESNPKPRRTVIRFQNEADLESAKQLLPANRIRPPGGTIVLVDSVRQKFMVEYFLLDLKTRFGPIYITYLLVFLNIVGFIYSLYQGADFFDTDAQTMLRIGANFGPATFSGQWWRLISCIFLHLGLFHKLLNMNALVQIGTIMERLLGKWIFLIDYLGCGVMSSFASLYFNNDVVSAGASGAIFGIYGTMIGYFLREKQEIPNGVISHLQKSTLVFIAYNVIFGFMAVGIDNATHIGGLLTGILLGFVGALPFETERRETHFVSRAFISSVVMIAMGIGFIS